MTRQISDARQLMADLVALHERMGVGIVYLQTNCRAPNRFAAGRTKLKTITALEYLPMLRQLIAQHGKTQLQAMLADTTERLEKGHTTELQGLKVDERYVELTRHYEILCDALLENGNAPSERSPILVRLDNRIATFEPVLAEAVS